MKSWKLTPLLLLALGLTGHARPSSPEPLPGPMPGSHTWDITEVFSNADGTIQFVELRECCGGTNETGLPGHTLSSGSKSFSIPGPALTAPTSNKYFLIATAAFASLPGAPTPDRIIPAGSLPFFFSTSGDTVSYVPWDSWTFGAVPTDGVNSLQRSGAVGPNTPTNYAGVTGTVHAVAVVPAMGTRSVIVLAVLSVLALAAILMRRSA